ncbi:helix-turn-helix transcriptional regulator [bacterium]|nr:helix-turn-helix transcriptional regulator [bacterium]
MSDIKKLLGQKIKSLRKSRGFSQLEFAEKIDISLNGLGIIETGKGFLTADTLEKILNVLNIAPDELFSFGGTENEQQLYDNIIRLLENVKNDREKLSKVYNIIKTII